MNLSEHYRVQGHLLLVRDIFGRREPIECDVSAMIEAVSMGLLTLTPNESAVLAHRYGLRDGVILTYEAIAGTFSLTRERIHQIHAKALRKMRHPSRSRAVRDIVWPDVDEDLTVEQKSLQ